jgi:hypothetical protein
MNIDITESQFDIEGLYSEAKKIGLDAGDLAEYGFDFKSAKCNGKTCFNPKNIKDYDDFVNKSSIFSKKMVSSGSSVYKKATCHPFMQKHVVPKVEFIWNMFPLDCFFGFSPLSWSLNALFIPCCWCFFIPFYSAVVLPWNLFCFIGLIGPIALFLYPCLLCNDNGLASIWKLATFMI